MRLSELTAVNVLTLPLVTVVQVRLPARHCTLVR